MATKSVTTCDCCGNTCWSEVFDAVHDFILRGEKEYRKSKDDLAYTAVTLLVPAYTAADIVFEKKDVCPDCLKKVATAIANLPGGR